MKLFSFLPAVIIFLSCKLIKLNNYDNSEPAASACDTVSQLVNKAKSEEGFDRSKLQESCEIDSDCVLSEELIDCSSDACFRGYGAPMTKSAKAARKAVMKNNSYLQADKLLTEDGNNCRIKVGDNLSWSAECDPQTKKCRGSSKRN